MAIKLRLILFTLFISLFPTMSRAVVPIKDITVLGISPMKATLNSVRYHLSSIGGFLQARSTYYQDNIDKFFTWSQIRDSYYVTFRYDAEGQVTSILRLYRFRSILNSNKLTPITTQEVAQKIIQQIGKPTQIIHKGSAGMPSYLAYIWKDDNITVMIDRQGGESLGHIFIKYIVNKVDPYFAKPKKSKIKTASR